MSNFDKFMYGAYDVYDCFMTIGTYIILALAAYFIVRNMMWKGDK